MKWVLFRYAVTITSAQCLALFVFHLDQMSVLIVSVVAQTLVEFVIAGTRGTK